jgi:hypothetical protein
MRIADSRATKIRLVASTKAQALRVILASPSFRPETRPQSTVDCQLPIADWKATRFSKIGNRQSTFGNLLGGLREKKLFCPGDSFPHFRFNSSRVHSRPAESISQTSNTTRSHRSRHSFDHEECRDEPDD